MKVPPKGAILGGVAIVVVAGIFALNSQRPQGFTIAPPKGTGIRLETFSDSTIKISGVAATEVGVKMALNQRLEFTSDPGPQQSLDITTDSCFIDSTDSSILSLAGVEEAMQGFKLTMAIKPNGEPMSITPTMSGTPSAVAENVVSSQLMSLQAAGPMGYTLPSQPPAKGQKWTQSVDLMDAVRDSTSDFVTPIEAYAQFTFTYVGHTTHSGVKVHHIKRSGTGKIRQKVNVQGMSDRETETKMSSEADIYIDADTALLVYLESNEKADIDFGEVKMNQTTKVTVKGSKSK